MAASLLMPVPSFGSSPLPVVTTFSILSDFVKAVGGEAVDVISLIGAGDDVHAFQPTPTHARQVAAAHLVVSNGLGFEGWIDRLVRSSGYRGPLTVATKGLEPLLTSGHSSHGHAHGGQPDPHAWQSVANVRTYVENIADSLCQIEPSRCGYFRSNAARYVERLAQLHREIQQTISALPQERRKVITSHDAFGYYARDYGVKFLAPVGISTDAAPSAAGVARLIRQIRKEKVNAFFIDGIANDRLIDRIREETGGARPGMLYSDALSDAAGPAGTYEAMMRYNTNAIVGALTGPGR